jgi:hypothetical protein
LPFSCYFVLTRCDVADGMRPRISLFDFIIAVGVRLTDIDGTLISQ